MHTKTSQPVWSATILKDDATGALSTEFRVPTAEDTYEFVIVANEQSVGAAVRAIRSRTMLLASSARAAATFVDTLRKQAGRVVPATRRTGWKTTIGEAGSETTVAFVTPGFVLNFTGSRYRWLAQAGQKPSALGRRSTSKPRAQARAYAPFATSSSYIAFAMMCALAAPLRRFATLPEDPIFNLFGPSSAGKTTAARVAAAVQGHPDAMASWDQKPRGLEETAAAHNDLLFILNAAERSPLRERLIMLDRIVHMIAEGGSTVRSRGVQAEYPDLAWRGVTLSTSNASGRGMAEAMGRRWEDQDAARFIDIEVPHADSGGIFDRRTDAGTASEQPGDLVQSLEKVLSEHYGAMLPPWVSHLGREKPTKRVERLILRFVRIVGQPVGLEERIARKFGLVYAAGKIANEELRLGWPERLPRDVVRDLYERSLAHRQAHQKSPPQRFAELLAEKGNQKRARPNGVIDATDRAPLAIDLRYKGRRAIGVRMDALRKQMPIDHRAIVAWLEKGRLVLTGHGSKRACQVPIRMKVGEKVVEKPRLLLLDPDKLETALQAARVVQ